MHGNARLTPVGRLTMVLRIESGRPVAHVAAEMGISRPTAYKWWRRWQAEGADGLLDRSSRANSCPHRTPPAMEAAIAELRQVLKLGPVRIGQRLGAPASTVHRVLCRLGINRLAWMDRPTGQVIRRIVTERPGELVHIDVKKLGRIPEGGGWRVRGVGYAGQFSRKHHSGYGFVHSAVDGHTRLAYSEVLPDEKGATAATFWQRAERFFAGYSVTVEAVLTDNGSCYVSNVFNDALGDIKHRRTRPRRPQTNGKVERFNRTLLDEWAYVRPYASEAERVAALDGWLHLYNHHRYHSALGGPPVSRVNDPAGQHT
ncbi:MAG: IS481 family transposase [Actinobacteria bacterium]|nr:IS481 family transposase [Actinomycetota bacterium]